MKIAIIHYRVLLRGGLETRLINYTNHLVELGHEITIICAKKSEEVILPPSVKVVQLRLGLVPKVFRLLYFNRKLKAFFDRHTFDFRFSLGRTFYQDAVLAPNNHLGFLKAMNKKGNRITDKIQAYLDRKSFDQTPVIFACSEMIKEEMQAYYNTAPEKIEVLYPPLNTQNFNRPTSTERQQLREKYGISPDTKVFVFISASHKRKGLEILLDAFQQLEGEAVKLFVAGYPAVQTSLSNVETLGFVEAPRELYIMADFTLHPARYEPFGQIISESLAVGTPVLVSNKVGAKSIISATTGLVLPSLDPQVWAATLRRVERSDFHVPEDLVVQFGLGLEAHLQRILAYAPKTKDTKNNLDK